MDKPRHPNVIRTWVLNRTHAHGRPLLPAKFPNKRKAQGAPRRSRET
jgi:hypothetical protein